MYKTQSKNIQLGIGKQRDRCLHQKSSNPQTREESKTKIQHENFCRCLFDILHIHDFLPSWSMYCCIRIAIRKSKPQMDVSANKA